MNFNTELAVRAKNFLSLREDMQVLSKRRGDCLIISTRKLIVEIIFLLHDFFSAMHYRSLGLLEQFRTVRVFRRQCFSIFYLPYLYSYYFKFTIIPLWMLNIATWKAVVKLYKLHCKDAWEQFCFLLLQIPYFFICCVIWSFWYLIEEWERGSFLPFWGVGSTKGEDLLRD